MSKSHSHISESLVPLAQRTKALSAVLRSQRTSAGAKAGEDELGKSYRIRAEDKKMKAGGGLLHNHAIITSQWTHLTLGLLPL